MSGDRVDIEPLLPTEKKYSVVKLNPEKPPTDEEAAVKMYEVNDPEEAETPVMDAVWMVYDADGNSQFLD